MASRPTTTRSSASASPSGSQAIRIVCRVRPFLPDELSSMLSPPDADDIDCHERSIAVVHKGAKHKYQFSSVHGPGATQKDVFTADVAPMLDSVYRGVSSTIFSYGMTGSGKTHTMSGDPRSTADMGIVPRVVKALFLKQARMRKVKIHLAVEYLEIYKDECYDLLVPRTDKPVKLDVRTNDKGFNIVAGLVRKEISTALEFEELWSRASAHRRTEKTQLNNKSSRSHAVLSIHVRTQEVSEHGKVWTGKINLIDLAGSENNKLTGNDRDRLAESSAINKSLTTLGNVIDALNKGHARVPYRDSKLTRILQDTLGGHSVGLLICGIAPNPQFRQDTINTLNFAIRTKEVENRVTVDERDNKPPATKPHVSTLNKADHLYAPPSRLATALGNIRPAAAPVAGKKPLASASSGRKFGTDLKNVAPEDRPRTVSASGKPGVVIGRKAVAPAPALVAQSSAKGKERQVEEIDFEALVKAKVAEELERQMAEFKRTMQASANDSLAAPREDVLDARIEYLEKTVKAQVEKSAAEDMLEHARKHHDRAYHHDDRAQLEMALDFYQQALTYMPGKKTIMTRIHDIQQAIALGLPVPPRKGAAKLNPPLAHHIASTSRPPSTASSSRPVDFEADRVRKLPKSFNVANDKPKSTLNIFADPAFVKPKELDALDIIPLSTPPSQPMAATAKSRAKPAGSKKAHARGPPTPAPTSEEEADIETAAKFLVSTTSTRTRATRAMTSRAKKNSYREVSSDDDGDDLGGLSDGDWVPS